ncbi:MAG: hypothetical protein IT175_14270 [Acidobacteria bacterium]|nr:hypothetical protein [Acidobacteriota bacterium]
MASLESPRVLTESKERPSRYDLTDCELEILRVTRLHSKSTVTIAEEVGLGADTASVTPILDRLEGLNLLDGFYAAGRVMTSVSEDHRRYYRTSELGERVSAPGANRSDL